MKAILVIDEMPTGCIGCPCYYEDKGKCENTWESVEDDFARPSWCPLKPLPERKDEGSVLKPLPFEVYMYRYGFNECLDEIAGETE